MMTYRMIHSIAHYFQSVFERFFRRFSWLEKKSFELGSLVNIYLGFNSNSDLESRKKKVKLIRERTTTVLGNYKRKTYNAFKELSFQVNDPKQLLEDMCRACSIVHLELIGINRSYFRYLKLKELLQSVKNALS